MPQYKTSPINDNEKLEKFAEQDRVQLFEILHQAFQEAVHETGEPVEIFIKIAGQTICLKFAGDTLVTSLARAFSHLIVPPCENPDLIINFWDSASSGRPLPLLIGNLISLLNSAGGIGLHRYRGDVLPFTDRRIRCSLHAENILTVLDFEKKSCVYWIADASLIPYYDVGAPLRMPFGWWFGSPTRQMIHSGAVGNEQGGVLLGGKGGSGKSTTALNCLDSPLFYASDDYVLVELEPQPVAYSLYNTAKVKTIEDLSRFPKFQTRLANSEGVKNNEEKPMMFVNEEMPEKIIRRIPLKAIVFPKFTAGENYRVRKISQQTAFREISLSTLSQTPYDDKECLQMISRLVRRLPIYEFVFGEEQSRIHFFINQILEENC